QAFVLQGGLFDTYRQNRTFGVGYLCGPIFVGRFVTLTRIDEVFGEISRSRRLPIIFIGSGISKRYTSNTFNWKELLIKCISGYDKNPENKYRWYIEKISSE